MNFSTTPGAIHAYRQMKYTMAGQARRCKGPCGKSRSVAQFDGANELCKQCVRRTPK